MGPPPAPLVSTMKGRRCGPLCRDGGSQLGVADLLKAPIFVYQGRHNKYHRLGGFNNNTPFPPGPGEQISKLEVSAGLVSRGLSPGLADGHLLTVSSQGLCSVRTSPNVSLLPNLFSQRRLSNWIRAHPNGLVLTQLTSSKTLSPYTVTFWRTGS